MERRAGDGFGQECAGEKKNVLNNLAVLVRWQTAQWKPADTARHRADCLTGSSGQIFGVFGDIGLDIGPAHRAGKASARRHIIESLGIREPVGRADALVFLQAEKADVLTIGLFVVVAEGG